jgi:serine/threonine-protein kinase
MSDESAPVGFDAVEPDPLPNTDALRQALRRAVANQRRGCWPAQEHEQLAGWFLSHAIGQGRVGVVYVAQAHGTQEYVALKLLRADLAANPVLRAEFVDQARHTMRVRHDQLVPINYLEAQAERPYVLMPLLVGTPLSERLAAHERLSAAEVINLGQQLAAGLLQLHQAGILHECLWPGNVWYEMGSGSERWRLLDAGLVRRLTHGATLTQLPLHDCAHEYLAPEQVTGDALGPATDVFSLGCVLIHAATGQSPFRGASVIDTLHAITSGQFPPALLATTTLPAELCACFAQMLAASPAARPTLAQVAQQLRTWLEPPQVTAPYRGNPSTQSAPLALLGDPDEVAPSLVLELDEEPVVELLVTAGHFLGRNYRFTERDTFLVGRGSECHFRLKRGDPFFSRRHFMIEFNPPRGWIHDLKSRNGTFLNGERIQSVELTDGDEIKAGHTILRVNLFAGQTGSSVMAPSAAADASVQAPGYELLTELGRGGMGVVYKARRHADGQLVALKMFPPQQAVTQRQVNLFLREAHILSQLQHPNIVAFHEVGQTPSGIFLAMEWIEGHNLHELVRRQGPLVPQKAVRLICHLLPALAYAHAHGFVHRDIKPANLFLGGPPKRRIVKLGDFGLARLYEASKLSGLTQLGEHGGTPAFMAPEQVTHFRLVKPPTDQYSVAATLYWLLTRHFVHDLPPQPQLQLLHVMTEPIVPLAQRGVELPAGLAAVIERALAREPAERYADVLELRAALMPFV